MIMTNDMVIYIADYVNEEITRENEITKQTILDAIDAYFGGAR